MTSFSYAVAAMRRAARSLRFKLVVIPLSVMVVTFLLLVLFGASALQGTLEASQMRERKSNADFLAAQLDVKLRARMDELASAGGQLDMRRLGDHAYLQQFLKERYPFEKDFSAGLLIIAPDGMTLADYPVAPGRRGAYFRDRDYYLRAIATRRPVISKPFIARPLNRPAVALSVPMYDAHGKLQALMVGAIDLSTPEFLGMATDGAHLGTTERYVVSFKDGVFIAATDKSRLLTPIPLPGTSVAMDRLRTGFAGAFIAPNVQNIEKIYAVARVPRTEWVVVEAVATDTAFRPVAHLRTTLLAGLAVALCALLLAAALLTRRSLAPLFDAARQMDEMSRGRQPLGELPVQGETEVRELLTSFNRLSRELMAHRHHLEDAVARRTAEVSELYNRAPCGYHSLDANGVFIHINDTELAWFGYRRDEVIGKMRPLDLLTPASQRIFHENFPKMKTVGSVAGLELEFIRRDGSVMPILLEANADFDEQGQLLQTRSILTDNSERKRANEALVAARDAAESADRAKSDFVANMSHEIRTPMNAVLGLAYLLGKIRLPDEAASLVGKIDRAGRLLLSVINDILDLSKVESGKLELENGVFRLSEVLTNVASVMSINAADKELELIVTPSTAGVDLVCGDALRLEQVLINLTNNAIKFTETGFVNVRIDTLEAGTRHVALRFAVRDSGIGITEQVRAQLFKPFTQGDASTTRRFGGSGLGLTISQRLVALMGGEIGVISTPGAGSEFWFVLEFERAAEPQLSTPDLAGIELLIADDSEIATEALRLTASNLGWHAQTVDSGRKALERVRERHAQNERHDVILLDWKMPDMDGLATARAIHESCAGQHEPIVLMVTAHARKDLLDDPEAALVDGVLNKPVTASTLYNAVAQALYARRGDGPAAAPAPSAAGRLEQVRMLLVDDSDINREVAQRIFGGEGAQVTLANDGRQALEWLQTHPGAVDIVLMDVQMPVMDGYEATRLIRQDPALAALPVLALTAGAFKGQQDAARAAGMNDYIAKPFQVDHAIATILRLTGRAAAPARPEHEEPDGSGDLPGLAIARGMATWKDAAVYRQYLRKFAGEYGDGGARLAQAGREEAAAQAHRLAGTAGNLALHQVAEAALAFEHALRADEGTLEAAHDTLQSALETALSSIALYAPAAPRQPDAAGPIDRTRVSGLLTAVLDAYDTDDPLSIAPILGELESLLPHAQVAPLRLAVENFDFRGGEAATRALAQALQLTLRS